MEVFKRWWNGKYGRIARRDLYVWTDGSGHWEVEARRGGVDGLSYRRSARSERAALELAQIWRDKGGDEWRDITDLGRKRARPDTEQG